jgi:hypothetical protein
MIKKQRKRQEMGNHAYKHGRVWNWWSKYGFYGLFIKGKGLYHHEQSIIIVKYRYCISKRKQKDTCFMYYFSMFQLSFFRNLNGVLSFKFLQLACIRLTASQTMGNLIELICCYGKNEALSFPPISQQRNFSQHRSNMHRSNRHILLFSECHQALKPMTNS